MAALAGPDPTVALSDLPSILGPPGIEHPIALAAMV
jgi:hypothetical protein